MARKDYETLVYQHYGLDSPETQLQIEQSSDSEISHYIGDLVSLEDDADLFNKLVEKRRRALSLDEGILPQVLAPVLELEDAQRSGLAFEILAAPVRQAIKEETINRKPLAWGTYQDIVSRPQDVISDNRKHRYDPEAEHFIAHQFQRDKWPKGMDGFRLMVGHRDPKFYHMVQSLTAQVSIPEKYRTGHTHITGGTRVGKSHLMKNIFMSYVEHKPNTSLLLIDPHGDLSKEIARNPSLAFGKTEQGDSRLVYLAPSDENDLVPILNPLERPKDESGSYTQSVEAFASSFTEVMTTLLNDIGDTKLTDLQADMLLKCVWVLVERNITDFMKLIKFLNPPQTERATDNLVTYGKQSTNPIVANYFASKFMETSTKVTKSGLASKLEILLTSQMAQRLFFGQSTVNLGVAIDQGYTVILDLGDCPSDAVGDMLGRFVLTQIYNHAKKRRQNRRPTHVFIDEAQRFFGIALAKSLEEVGKKGLHYTIAHQFSEQGFGRVVRSIENCTQVTLRLRDKTHDIPKYHVIADFGDGNSKGFLTKITENHKDKSGMISDRDWQGILAEQHKAYYRQGTAARNTASEAPEGPVSGFIDEYL